MALTAVCRTSNLFGALHSYFLRTWRTTNYSVFLLLLLSPFRCRYPPNVVLKRKAIAMWAQIRQNDTSLFCGWCDDPAVGNLCSSTIPCTMLKLPASSLATFSKASRVLPKVHSVALTSTLKVLLCFSQSPSLNVCAVCVRTTYYSIQNFLGRRLFLPVAFYPFLLFLLNIVQKLFSLSPFQEKSTPTFLSQHFLQSATMRFLFHHCLPLPRLQRRLTAAIVWGPRGMLSVLGTRLTSSASSRLRLK